MERCISLAGRLSELQMTNYPIQVEAYNPEWPMRFEILKELLTVHLDALIREIHHVGSTAVPGLAAKPVIDLDVILNDLSQLSIAIEQLEQLGYSYNGEMGITGRHAFFAKNVTNRFAHHLYICDPQSNAFKNHICLREFLRNNETIKHTYADLKKQLAASNAYDMDAYVQGKTAFITGILATAGFDDSALDLIQKENTFDAKTR